MKRRCRAGRVQRGFRCVCCARTTTATTLLHAACIAVGGRPTREACVRASCVCGPGGSRTGGGAERQQVPAAGGVTRGERGSARLSKAGQGKVRRGGARRSDEAGYGYAGLSPISHERAGCGTEGQWGGGLKGWRKGGSVGSKKIMQRRPARERKKGQSA